MVLIIMVSCLAFIYSLILHSIVEVFIVPIVIVINLFIVTENLISLQAIYVNLIGIHHIIHMAILLFLILNVYLNCVVLYNIKFRCIELCCK